MSDNANQPQGKPVTWHTAALYAVPLVVAIASLANWALERSERRMEARITANRDYFQSSLTAARERVGTLIDNHRHRGNTSSDRVDSIEARISTLEIVERDLNKIRSDLAFRYLRLLETDSIRRPEE